MKLPTKLLTAAVLSALSVSASAQSYLGVTVPPIDTFTRDEVTTLWRSYGLMRSPLSDGKRVTQNWTGSYDSCNPGSSSVAWQEMMLRYVNTFRSLTDAPPVALITGQTAVNAQGAALTNALRSASGLGFSHNLTQSDPCYSASARDGAIASQLGGTTLPTEATLDTLIDDQGALNYNVGHRLAILWPESAAFGVGSTPRDDARKTLNMTALAMSSAVQSVGAAVPMAWPSAGYFPATMLPRASRRWSVGCMNCDFREATIKVEAEGVEVPVAYEPTMQVSTYVNSYRVFTLPENWQSRFVSLDADGFFDGIPSYSKTAATVNKPLPVTVTVSGGKSPTGAAMAPFSYTVTLFNPDYDATLKTFPTQRYDGVWGVNGEDWSLNLNLARNGVLVGYWATFDDAGNPTWYSVADGRWTGASTFSGKLLALTSTNAVASVVGGLTISFADRTNATFAWTLNGNSGQRSVTRQMQGVEQYVDGTHNYTDVWTAGLNGGGVSITQDWRSPRALYTYFGSDGKPTWARSGTHTWTLANAGANTATLSAPLIRFRGTSPDRAWNSGTATQQSVGTLNASFNAAADQVNWNLSMPDRQFSGVGARAYTAQWTQGFNVPLSKRGGVDVDGNGRSALVVRDAQGGEMLAGRLVNDVFQWTPLADPGANFRVLGAVDLGNTGRSDLLMLDTSQPGEFGNVFAWRGFNSSNSQLLRQIKKAWDLQVVGDMDGNGPGDLVWRWTTADADFGVSYIWFTDPANQSTPVQQVRKRGGAPLSWRLLGAMDVNDDGAADMVYLSPANQVRVLMATGTANAPRTCANFAAGQIPAGFSVLSYKDFTGARRGGDLLLRNDATGELRVLSLVANSTPLPTYTGDPNDRNASCTGAGSGAAVITTQVSMGTVDPTWGFFASGDFNGDGTFDVAWRKPDNSLAVTLFSVNGQPRTITNAGTVATRFAPIPLQ
jgi:hypothetical protein